MRRRFVTGWRLAVGAGAVAITTAVGLACSSFEASGTPATVDASDESCNATMPFVRYASLGNTVNTPLAEVAAGLTPDELRLFVTVSNGKDINIDEFQRPSLTAPWASVSPEKFPFAEGFRGYVWTGGEEGAIYLARIMPGTPGWRLAKTAADGGAFDYLSPALTADGGTNDLAPFLGADESEIWFVSNRAGNNDIYRAARDAATGEFGAPAAVVELNTQAAENSVVLSRDLRSVYFASASGRLSGSSSIWIATRGDVGQPFDKPKVLADLKDLQDDTGGKNFSAYPSWLSPDECRLYVYTTRDDGKGDIYVASRR